MFVSLKWLKDYVDIDVNINEFIDAMTMSGTKVEGIDILGDGISNVVVGKIIDIQKHPDADKLVVTKVDVGSEVIQIVTGANNISVGDYVPIALVGATLPGNTKIKKAKLRGLPSHGMMCSAMELGMNVSLMPKEETEGIYILNDQYSLGQDIKPILGLDDVIVEFELTANRSDCLSVVGIAREVAATFNKHLLQPIVEISENDEDISKLIKVDVLDTDLCPRYMCKMFRINKIEASPAWMQERLLNSGVRPINNIVDVTNYVMLELGQPLHAFDYEKIQSKELIIRRAKEGEILKTLDGVERTLDPSMLMIADKDKPIAIAGVMGGGNSEIDQNTKIIAIESANFDGASIRLASKKLGLRTEASSRFEKGLDPNLVELAINRVVQLLTDIGAGEIIGGQVDVYPNPIEQKQIVFNSSWANRFIGIDLKVDEIIDLLERIELEVKVLEQNKNEASLEVLIPSVRQDLEIKEDIAEEIARIYGYNNIPNTIMSGITVEGRKTEKQKFEQFIKNIIISKGGFETLTYSFFGPSKLADLNLEKADKRNNTVKVVNPLGEENSLMRTTLMSHMLQVISHNYNRNISEGFFFELSPIYYTPESFGKELPIEQKMLCLAEYGEIDFFDLKGKMELIFKSSGVAQVEFIKAKYPTFHPGRCADINVNGQYIGTLGEIHQSVAEKFNIPDRTYLCEINFDLLFSFSNREKQFKELPKYPSITRDIALLVKDEISAGEIEKIIEGQGKNILESFKLFDVYKGKQIPQGYKSIAYTITYRAKDKTLTDDEVSKVYNKLIITLQSELDAKLRD